MKETTTEATLEDFKDRHGFDWPNCATPDCEFKRCLWSGTNLCFPCAEHKLGHAEIVRRYNATHDITWEQAIKEDDEDDDTDDS